MTLMSRITHISLIVVLLIFLCVPAKVFASDPKGNSYQVLDCKWQQNGDSWVYRIIGNVEPAYTMYELFSPHRLIVDIANGGFAESVRFPIKPDNDGPVTLIKGALHKDSKPPVARIELILVDDRVYSISSKGDEILIQFENSTLPDTDSQIEEQKDLVISDVDITSDGNVTKVHMVADKPIQRYQSLEQGKSDDHPARLMIDLPGVTTKESYVISPQNQLSVSFFRTEVYSDGTRVILDSADNELFRYSIAIQKDGLLINVEPSSDPAPIIAAITGGDVNESDRVASALHRVAKRESGDEKGSNVTATKSLKSPEREKKDDFGGYTEQKISVDFYKIDLHNVFRLIGEISGKNIVVDEKVGGSLTLALNDVPWDFVLDVVLNLKNLAKEERYNTIVISQRSDEQKTAGFVWPERQEEKLSIKKEAISVTKRMEVPKEKLEARKFVRQAKNSEDSGDYEKAVMEYEKAFLAWPENGDIAKRISYLSLVKLGLNAKAVHYGKIASNLLPQDTEVALQTALSMANMEMVHEAKSYFDFAVSGPRPTRYALASYAVFCEQNGSNDMALSLLEKYERLYGTTLETLVSKARIYDKIGDSEKAGKEYQAVLLSGYNVPGDLEKYIKGRLSN